MKKIIFILVCFIGLVNGFTLINNNINTLNNGYSNTNIFLNISFSETCSCNTFIDPTCNCQTFIILSDPKNIKTFKCASVIPNQYTTTANIHYNIFIPLGFGQYTVQASTVTTRMCSKTSCGNCNYLGCCEDEYSVFQPSVINIGTFYLYCPSNYIIIDDVCVLPLSTTSTTISTIPTTTTTSIFDIIDTTATPTPTPTPTTTTTTTTTTQQTSSILSTSTPLPPISTTTNTITSVAIKTTNNIFLSSTYSAHTTQVPSELLSPTSTYKSNDIYSTTTLLQSHQSSIKTTILLNNTINTKLTTDTTKTQTPYSTSTNLNTYISSTNIVSNTPKFEPINADNTVIISLLTTFVTMFCILILCLSIMRYKKLYCFKPNQMLNMQLRKSRFVVERSVFDSPIYETSNNNHTIYDNPSDSIIYENYITIPLSNVSNINSSNNSTYDIVKEYQSVQSKVPIYAQVNKPKNKNNNINTNDINGDYIEPDKLFPKLTNRGMIL